jgi:hypothetical protein
LETRNPHISRGLFRFCGRAVLRTVLFPPRKLHFFEIDPHVIPQGFGSEWIMR